VFAYVPQIKMKGFPFPFLACNIDRMDHGLIGWDEKDRSYDHYNLMFDVPFPGLHRKKISDDEDDTSNDSYFMEGESDEEPNPRPIYSIIRHYPTKWQLELAEKNKPEIGKKNQ
jgi:hypothetical protein